MEKKRIFAAIDISGEARARVSTYVKSLQKECAGLSVRWEKFEKLHITVKFMGSINIDELKEFTLRVANAAKSTPPFQISIAETGAFVRRSSRANVLWLGLQSYTSNGAAEMIEELAAEIDGKNRRLRPHLTIARLKDATTAKQLIQRHLNAKFEPVTFDATEITIYESNLLPTGSVYTALSRHKFAG